MKDYLQPRQWKLRAEAHASEIAELGGAELAALAESAGIHPLAARVYAARGINTPEAIQAHREPSLDRLTNPLSIRDMGLAVDRLVRARERGEKIWVFGDYDVDGTTGTALLSWVFRELGFAFHATQPHRFKDGYGLNTGAVEQAAQDGAKVLITVDCGITSFAQATRARELGVDLIVVDHHQLDPVRGLPEAHAVLNPQRPDCESGLKQLCGCGLAFYLAMALRARGRELGWPLPNLRQHLDLVVMATAADMVPLTGDNHILVRHGMEVLKSSRKPGVKALLEAAGVGARDVSPGHLGFILGPRINASGRMQSASLALELLTTTEPVRAIQLAQELEGLNRERAELQNRIWDQVRAKVEEGIAQGRFRHGVVVGDPSWHEGVVGIVASRVTETFRRPAAVIAIREDGSGKGSVRSYGGKDVLAALRESAEQLSTYGGHRHAAGLAVTPGKLEAFAEAFDRALGAIEEDASLKPLLIEGECELGELDVLALEQLEQLGPFGPGNPEPVFMVRARVAGHQILKERHLKLRLSGDNAPLTLEAIWFNAAERQDVMDVVGGQSRETLFWAGVPELNRFRGQTTPTFRIRDWRDKNPSFTQ